MSNGTLSNSNTIRLCHIIKWSDFDGYGFNLHAEKGKPGQYIGKVDEASPAEAAGLKEGDRIIEVNGVNISNENHKQVVQRIKTLPEETKLLVVDAEADNHFKSKSIVIKNTHPNVVYLKTPVPRPNSGQMNGMEIDDNHSQKSGKSGLSTDNEVHGDKLSYKGNSNSTTPSSERKRSLGSSPEPQSDEPFHSLDGGANDDGSWDSLNKNMSSSVPTMNSQKNSLNLNMTAAELRAQLAARKKHDPKKDTLDFKKKYDIVQKL